MLAQSNNDGSYSLDVTFALCTAVFAGMIGVTFFGIFLTPVFFYVVRRFASKASLRKGHV